MEIKQNKGIVTFAEKPVTLLGEMIKTGDIGKDFTIIGQGLNSVKLSDFEGKIKIISVVPSVDTGICAAQTRRFNVEAAKLDNIIILTISMDLPFALKRFCAAEGIDKVITLSDHKDADFGLKYGFLIEELRLLARGIVILDKSNKVQYVEYVKEITTHPDYDKALEVVKQINK